MTWLVLGLTLISVTISAVAQIVLKYGMSSAATKAALAAGGTQAALGIAGNPWVWLGFGLYGFGAVLWLGVLAKVDVSQAYPFVGLGFLLTMLFGITVLGEAFSVTRLLGTLLVLAGVVLVASPSDAAPKPAAAGAGPMPNEAVAAVPAAATTRASLAGAGRLLPLVADLDGTLIRSDLLLESFLLLARQKPWLLFSVPLWLRRGRSHLKQRIAESVDFNAEYLPYNAEFIAWLKEEKAAGRKLVLATASTRRLAQPVAEHLGIFDEVVASDETVNLKGSRKLEALKERYGAGGFDYAADARADIPVWREANAAVLVGASAGLAKQMAGEVTVAREFPKPGFSIKPFIKAIRVRQWVKNILVFLPLLAGQAFGEPELFLKALTAFFAVSLSASSMYIMNDLLDLPSYRRHRTKHKRPFASGALSILTGLWLCPLLMLAGLGIAASLSLETLGLVLLYVVITTFYSFWLKRKMLIDVFVLALLYTLRVLIGSVATGILASPWLLGFSVFTFLSLAAAKRGAELLYLELSGREGVSGRDYYVWDRHVVTALGQGAAFGASLVLALYIQSHEVHLMYAQPSWLWLLVPLILYWLSRIWMVTLRGAMDDDPIVFAVSDRLTWIVAAICAAIVALAKFAVFPLPGAQP